MVDWRRLAVHQPRGPHHLAAEHLPMHWCPRQTPRIGTCRPNARMISLETPAWSGVHGPGEMTMAVGATASPPRPASISSLRRTTTSAPELAEVLYQVVGERVVVVDHQDHLAAPPSAMAIALKHRSRLVHTSPRTLCSGSESATMPAPAWTSATPVLDDDRADRDARVHVAGEAEVADRARHRARAGTARARR